MNRSVLLLCCLGLAVACSEAAPLDSGAEGRGAEKDPMDGSRTPSASALVLNEVLTGTAGDGSDWLELHNPTDTAAELSGWAVGDDPEGKGWAFPEGAVVAAGGYLLVYADGTDTVENGDYHSDFKLSGDGETVVLWDAAGDEVDSVDVPALEDDTSYARETDAAEAWSVSERPSPGSANG